MLGTAKDMLITEKDMLGYKWFMIVTGFKMLGTE
jgi:hypothetical protein